jgi:hypothetical protein
MKKLSGKEIIEIITDKLEDAYEFESISSDVNRVQDETEDEDNAWLLSLGKCEMVTEEEFTSGEAYRVLYFSVHDVYIRQNGYYDSYESYAKYGEHDYDVVVPFEKTIIRYKKTDGTEDEIVEMNLL